MKIYIKSYKMDIYTHVSYRLQARTNYKATILQPLINGIARSQTTLHWKRLYATILKALLYRYKLQYLVHTTH